ncbi:RNA pseudouridine synthase [Actinidia chinensis var. chinensis]|uniref:RNA pseudouridine synthase n=1 Tax=Actinidia chinensis var. chinensis TaxID=1590841 RepID=A0A2R6PZF0_ACTCC|nr:RNA pseudouridine synthase [Actinidia chinensis var. chinensis]
MLSLHSLSAAKTLYGSSSLSFFRPSPRSFSRDSRTFRTCSSSAVASDSDESQHVRANFSGVDWTRPSISSPRSRGSIRGLRLASPALAEVAFGPAFEMDSLALMAEDGDKVECTISELQPLKAEPEDIPLDIVYEDEQVLVVNKPAHMVVHPAPGNATGTLVNSILQHCSMSTYAFSNQEVLSEMEDISDDEFGCFSPGQICDEDGSSGLIAASVRPGIVHRLDKGRVNIPIGRHMNNRICMTAVSGLSKSRQARHAASRYRIIEILVDGGSALVEWRLETGRTHQIRAHAKYLGIPLLGDEVYGGTKSMAMSLLRPKTLSNFHGKLAQLLSRLERPCLHALALKNPHTGESVNFSCLPPADFAETLSQLREISSQKVLKVYYLTHLTEEAALV